MKLKKIIAFMLTAAVSLGVLAGCGSKETVSDTTADKVSQSSGQAAAEESTVENTEESKTITFPLEEKMTFTAFTVDYDGTDLSERAAFQKFMEDNNIEIEFTSALQEELKEKRNLLLASGNYPDFFIKDNFTDVDSYGEDGILIPLEDLIKEYMPNLTAIMDERDAWSYIASNDGHIYSLPFFFDMAERVTPMWINKRWLDNLGLSEPESYEELYEILVAFKEQDANGNGDPNDEIPLAFNTSRTVTRLLSLADYAYSHNSRLAVTQEGELIYVPNDERFKEFLAYVTKLYSEGLIYEDCFTTDRNTMLALGQSGDIMGCYPETASFQMVGRDNDDDYVMIMPWDSLSETEAGINIGAMAITDKCENPEVLLAWVDYLYSEEGARLAYMGVEGEAYEFLDDGNWAWILGGDYGDDVATVRATATMYGGCVLPTTEPKAWRTLMSDTIDEDEVYLNHQRLLLAERSVVPLPRMKYSSEDAEELSVLVTDITGYVDEYTAKVVTGELDLEDSWDNYLDTLKKMGVDRMYELYKASYDTAMAAKE